MDLFNKLKEQEEIFKKLQVSSWKGGQQLFSLRISSDDKKRKQYNEIVNSAEFKEKNRLIHIDTLKALISIYELKLEIAKNELNDLLNKKSVEKSITNLERIS